MVILPMLPLVFMYLTFFPAIKREKYGSLLGITRQLVFYVPVMLILPGFYGVKWVYCGAVLVDAIMAIIIILLIMKAFKALDGEGRFYSAPR